MQETIETTTEETREEFVFEIEELEGNRAAMVLIPFDIGAGHSPLPL